MTDVEAVVSEKATLGPRTKIWHYAQVREGARIGSDCIISKGCYIDTDVQVGDRVKLQNNVSVYKGVTIEDEVFVGPHVCFTNDTLPRSCDAHGVLKTVDGWSVTPTRVERGASIGANATIVAGVTIGAAALVGAGSVVTKDVPPHAVVVGNPARVVGRVCTCGKRRAPKGEALSCSECATELGP